MEAEDKLSKINLFLFNFFFLTTFKKKNNSKLFKITDKLDGIKQKNEHKPQTMEDFLQDPDDYNKDDNSGKKKVKTS